MNILTVGCNTLFHSYEGNSAWAESPASYHDWRIHTACLFACLQHFAVSSLRDISCTTVMAQLSKSNDTPAFEQKFAWLWNNQYINNQNTSTQTNYCSNGIICVGCCSTLRFPYDAASLLLPSLRLPHWLGDSCSSRYLTRKRERRNAGWHAKGYKKSGNCYFTDDIV